MTMTDPIADMLTRIRNANTAMHDDVRMPSSKQKVALAKLLESEGYINGFEVSPSAKGPGDVLTIQMKYSDDRDRTISGLRRGNAGQEVIRSRPLVSRELPSSQERGAHASSGDHRGENRVQHLASWLRAHGANRPSERIVRNRLLDAIEKRLAQLGERELGLNPAHVHGGDRFLHAADDRDLADGDDAPFFLGERDGGRQQGQQNEQVRGASRHGCLRVLRVRPRAWLRVQAPLLPPWPRPPSTGGGPSWSWRA